jgi:hypothetical protein
MDLIETTRFSPRDISASHAGNEAFPGKYEPVLSPLRDRKTFCLYIPMIHHDLWYLDECLSEQYCMPSTL